MSVMLAFSLALGSLGYKQQVLASSAIESQYAFYAADAALECALYYDQQNNDNGTLFPYDPAITTTPVEAPLTFNCSGNTPELVPAPTKVQKGNGSTLNNTYIYRFSLDSDTRCADVTITKYAVPQPPDNYTAYLFSQGYDVPCTSLNGSGRYASRGLQSHY